MLVQSCTEQEQPLRCSVETSVRLLRGIRKGGPCLLPVREEWGGGQAEVLSRLTSAAVHREHVPQLLRVQVKGEKKLGSECPLHLELNRYLISHVQL